VRVYDHFSQWAAEVAQSAGVEFLDHIDIVANEYDKLGPEKVRGLFTDSTHTTAVGADRNASFVVAGLKTLNSPLVQYLSAKGQAVPAYDPSVTPPPGPAPAAGPRGAAPGQGPMPPPPQI
jgi:hypothetical protein